MTEREKIGGNNRKGGVTNYTKNIYPCPRGLTALSDFSMPSTRAARCTLYINPSILAPESSVEGVNHL